LPPGRADKREREREEEECYYVVNKPWLTVYGISMESMWNLYGIYMESIWNLFGMHLECIWKSARLRGFARGLVNSDKEDIGGQNKSPK
jgi:hypothetical protein